VDDGLDRGGTDADAPAAGWDSAAGSDGLGVFRLTTAAFTRLGDLVS